MTIGMVLRLPSDVPRDRPPLRRPVGQIDHRLVDIAPAPALGRIIAFDDRVTGRMEMRGRVAVRRIVAAADMAAAAAQPQMDPGAADLQAFLAAARAGRDLVDRRAVWAVGPASAPVARAAMAAWICATTAAPSPTAAATRLVEPARTSPIANTPGRLVSSGKA